MIPYYRTAVADLRGKPRASGDDPMPFVGRAVALM